MKLFTLRYRFKDNAGKRRDVLIFGPATRKAVREEKQRQCTLLDGSRSTYWPKVLHIVEEGGQHGG